MADGVRVLLIPVGFVILCAASLVALDLGVGWAAWIAAGSIFVWMFGALLGFWPGFGLGGDGD